MLEELTIPQIVNNGVNWLDEIEPDWYNRIDLTTFDMGNTDTCVIGQVFSHLYPDFNYYDFDKLLNSHEINRYDYGFDLHSLDGWEELQDEWIRRIKEKRHAIA